MYRYRHRYRNSVDCWRHRQCDAEVEPATCAQLALQLQRSAHQGDQRLADGDTQASAAEAARGGGLGLGKTGEDAGLVLWRNADAGVAHHKLQGRLTGAGLQHQDAHHHLAFSGEFDGVAAQVDQHLAQAQGIADQVGWYGRVDVKQHIHLIVVDAGRQDHRQIAQQLINAKRLRVQGELARFNLGQIQNVIQQAQQRACRAFGFADVVDLLGVEWGVLQQRRHAQNGVHGRPDFMAHIGQKATLGQHGFFRQFPRPDNFGDVDPKPNGMPIRHPSVNNAQGAAAV